jgi:hypothetical protein
VEQFRAGGLSHNFERRYAIGRKNLHAVLVGDSGNLVISTLPRIAITNCENGNARGGRPPSGTTALQTIESLGIAGKRGSIFHSTGAVKDVRIGLMKKTGRALSLCAFLTIVLLIAFQSTVEGGENAPLAGIAPDGRAITTDGELDRFTNTYYLSPRPELVPQAIKYIASNQILSKYDHVRLPLSAFFSRLFADNPSLTAGWKKEIGQDPATQVFFMTALESSPKRFIDESRNGIERNDVCWALFFASGDTAYLVEIVRQLQYLDEREDMVRYLAAATARWSLASNARAHPKVKAAMEALENGEDLKLREVAGGILRKGPQQISEETIAVLKEQKSKGIWR